MTDDHGRLPAVGFGLAYVLAGTALLLQEFDLLILSWSVVAPLILVLIGSVVLASGLFAIRASSSDAAAQTARQQGTGGPPHDH